MISATGGKTHWNYFIALERDLELASRYVEFCEHNFHTYSIEFAHLLFAAASEVDVVAKLLCHHISPGTPAENINQYRGILLPLLTDLPTTEVYVPRYGLTLKPWDEWSTTPGSGNPIWWRSYNNVKHQRDIHFNQATLKNALNALGALMILTFKYYSYTLSPGSTLDKKKVLSRLLPEPTLFRFSEDYYYTLLACN